MKPNTQWKINSVDDIVNHHEIHYKRFNYKLTEEINDYKNNGKHFMVCNTDGGIYVDYLQPNKEVVPNPYTTKELEPNSIDDLMQKLKNKANELGFEVDISFKPKNK